MPTKMKPREINIQYDKKFTFQLVKVKGYTLDELGVHWGITDRQVRNILNNPTQLQLDALAGLPIKVGNLHANT